jgi:alpha-L-fucosidase
MDNSRRNFLKQLTAAGAAMAFPLSAFAADDRKEPPAYLSAYKKLYAKDPHAAALAWFRDAGFGLFMHYGLYSLLGRGEWVQLHEKIPVAEYEKLAGKFTAEHFDANFITDLALAAGMKYVNLTAKHHEGFCLFKTAQTGYNSLRTPAGRDLVGELKEACDKKGLGMFLYYSIAADWHHPYFYSREAGWGSARPAYTDPQPAYLYKKESDFSKYITYARAQIAELVTQYQPAGIWFDPIMGFYARPDLFPMQDIYTQIRSLCPHTLVSFKQGATGTEDFAAPERNANSMYEQVQKAFGERSGLVAQKAWSANSTKHNETCNTMQPGVWGYRKDDDGKHLHVEQVLALLKEAREKNMNLLLNTGPLPDGSIYPEDADVLRQAGHQLRQAS